MRLLSVVVNYRTPELLNRFLETYAEYVDSDDRYLVVQDVEVNDSSAMIEIPDSTKGRVIYVANGENIGYARAVNEGVGIGIAEFGLFDVVAAFNADCAFLDRNCVDSTLGLMESDSTVGIVGPLQVDESGRITHAGVTGTNQQHHMRGWLSFRSDDYDDVIECVTVSGSAFFVRWDTWVELSDCELYTPFLQDSFPGAFLPTRHYYEETYCALHARAHGWKVMYNGKGKMIHSWHKSSPLNSDIDGPVMLESRELYRKACQHHGMEHN